MNYGHLITLRCLLFGTVSAVYGYLTGSAFFIRGSLLSSPLFDVIFLMAIIFSVFGLATFSLNQYSNESSKLADWLLPSFMSLLPVSVLVLALGSNSDWGRYFRFYVAPIAFYVLLVFSLCVTFFLKIVGHPKGVGPRYFLFLMVLIFSSGIGIYLLKDSPILTVNCNLAMQFILSMLCIVSPLYFALLAIRLKRYRGAPE